MEFLGTIDSGAAINSLDWLVGNTLVQFCTDVDGDVLAGATIVAGVSATDADNTPCMAAFAYRVDESNPSVSVWDDDVQVHRSCYFCTGDAASKYQLTSFTLPATSDSLISGIDAVASAGASNGEIWAQLNTAQTATVYLGSALTAPCSASFLKGSATSISYAGQGVTFSMPSVVNLAGGQYVSWASGTTDF
jgi:hypothetical protein